MKTSLDHLPETKRVILRDIVAIFREGAPIEMLILFGSHARGDWVGEAKGRREGEATGTAAAILLVLKTRGVAVPPEIEQRIAACIDPAVLSGWLERAVTAESAAEVVEPEGKPEGTER